MGFEKSEEELRILTDTYHDDILKTASDLYGLRYVNSDMLWDSDWDSLVEEPCFQMLFFDADDEIVDTDQFMIAKNLKSFAREPIEEDEFHNMYDIPTDEAEILFNLYIDDFLKSADKATPEQVINILNYNKFVIEIMFGIDYFKDYTNEELLKIYESTQDERFISKEAQDIFIF